MGLSSRNVVHAVTDIVHDVAAGIFPGAVIGAWLYERALGAASVGAGDPTAEATGPLLVLLLADLIVLVATGLVRLNHWQLNVRSGFLQTKAQMAVLKHIVFVVVLVLSAVALFRFAG